MDGEGASTRIRRRKMGFVFQRFNLIPSLSARENVKMALKISGVASADGATTALRAVGLSEKAERKPGELSIGEQQRVAIARAIVHHPRILLADEPTGNLDSGNSRAILDIFEMLNRKEGLTVVMITHNEEAASRAERVLHMRDGRIVGEDA